MAHDHRWSAWTSWLYYGSGRDLRERFCQGCPETEPDYREHQHNFGAVPDPHAPVGTGGTVRVCAACREVQ